jgi:hypothetical protein
MGRLIRTKPPASDCPAQKRNSSAPCKVAERHLGRALKRSFVGAAFTQKLVGAPDGTYETILFKTFFEHKTVAAERVILTRESAHWKVIEYRIY